MTNTETPTVPVTPPSADPLDILAEDTDVKHSRIDTAFYEAALKKSERTGKAFSYPVAAKSGDIKKEESALRQVAHTLGVGLKVQAMPNGNIKFQTAKLRAYTEESAASRKAKMAASAAERRKLVEHLSAQAGIAKPTREQKKALLAAHKEAQKNGQVTPPVEKPKARVHR